MSGTESGLYLPFCAILFSLLLFITYFAKKRIKIVENKLYSSMIVLTLIDSIISTLLQLTCSSDLETLDFSGNILNRIDFTCLILYATSLFIYVVLITLKDTKKNVKKVLNVFGIIDLIIIITMLFSPLNLLTDGEKISISGTAANITFIVSAFYIIASILVSLINFKKVDRRHLIVLFIPTIIFIDFLLYAFNPYIVAISITLTFINYIMYNTIENPDLKMVKELEFAKNQAEKANRAKSDFLSSMSHEIRTPLNAIVGLSEIIKESDNINEIHEDATDVVNASNTLLEIVNGILDISKIEADKMEIVETIYNPLEEFNNLVKLTEARIAEKDIVLRSDFAIDLPKTLYGDKGKVKQIITNLLGNAVKYTEKGYIDFKVSCINENNTSKLTIIVSDTGRGIKKDQIDNLFTKFNRLESDKNTTIEGTGLGLAITKSLVEMMGGKIVVDSVYGEGSKFTIFLNQKINNNEVKSNIEEKLTTFENKKVLLVDDNKLNIKVATKILNEFKLDIDECESGFECLEKVKNNNYDIILLDIMMPKMGGVETLKKLKKIDNFNTPVIALTADAIKGKSTKYIEVGFNDYLSKPIDKNKLNNVLNKALNNVVSEKKEYKEDPNIHKVIPITDEMIDKLNKRFGTPTLIENSKKETNNDNN